MNIFNGGVTYHHFTVDVASNLKRFVRRSLFGKLLIQIIKKSRCCFCKNTRFCFLSVVSGLVVCSLLSNEICKNIQLEIKKHSMINSESSSNNAMQKTLIKELILFCSINLTLFVDVLNLSLVETKKY